MGEGAGEGAGFKLFKNHDKRGAGEGAGEGAGFHENVLLGAETQQPQCGRGCR